MYRTIRKHEIILQDVLTDLIRTIIRLGKTANVSGLAENTDIVIDFDDSIIEDKQTERAEDRKDVAMGAMGLRSTARNGTARRRKSQPVSCLTSPPAF